jgi:hypothetical protein
VEELDVGKPLSNKTNASNLEIFNGFLLGLQIAGSGRKEAKIIPGLLNLSNGFMTKQYTDLQNELGLSIIGLSNKILEENLRLQIEATPRVVNGPMALSVSSNTRWDKQGSGHQYDSLSGCSMMLGNQTKLVIAVKAMSQVNAARANHTKIHYAQRTMTVHPRVWKRKVWQGLLNAYSRTTRFSSKSTLVTTTHPVARF